MVCFPRLTSILGVFAFALGAAAQGTPAEKSDTNPLAPTRAPAASAAVSPGTTPASSGIPGMPATRKRQRAISSDLAATLAQGMPKYEPPKPVEKILEDEELPDMRDVNKPANEIIRLPKVIVEGSKPPIFTEKDILTRKAFADLMAKRYYSEGYRAFSKAIGYTPLRFIFPSAEASAMAQYYEEERLKGMGTMADAANTAERLGDKAESAYIKRTSNETYMNRSDFGWHNPNK
jgi:hypothetical protein